MSLPHWETCIQIGRLAIDLVEAHYIQTCGFGAAHLSPESTPPLQIRSVLYNLMAVRPESTLSSCPCSRFVSHKLDANSSETSEVRETHRGH